MFRTSRFFLEASEACFGLIALLARFNEFNRNNEYIYFVMLGDYELGSIDDKLR